MNLFRFIPFFILIRNLYLSINKDGEEIKIEGASEKKEKYKHKGKPPKNREWSEKEQTNGRNRPNEHPNAGRRPQKHTKPDVPKKLRKSASRNTQIP